MRNRSFKLFLIFALVALFSGCAGLKPATPDYDILRQAEQGAAKLSEYETAPTPAVEDVVIGTDVSDTTMSATGTTKKFRLQDLPISDPVQGALDGKEAEIPGVASDGSEGLAVDGNVLSAGKPVMVQLNTLADLQTYTGPATTVYVRGRTADGDGYEGTFQYLIGDYSAECTADTLHGIYVARSGVVTTTGAWVRQYSGPVTVRWFGAKGDGATDDTAAIQLAMTTYPSVYVPAGEWLITYLSIPSDRVILTDGFSTVFKQKSGQAEETRVLRLVGSNISLGSCEVIGNIATDTGEQYHAVYIDAQAATGNLTNITVGDVRGTNLRGDVVYIGQHAGYTATNIHVGNVICNNILRNGVSIATASGISIKSVTGDRVGFCHVDLEPNSGGGPVTDVRVEYVKGRCVGVVGPTATDYGDAIEFGTVDLSPSNAAQSSPAYSYGAAINDGLLLRNVKRLFIGHFKACGFNRAAVFTTYNTGELGCELLKIGTMYLRNNSLADAVYNCHVLCLNMASNKMIVEQVDAAVSGSNKRIFEYARGAIIGHAVVDAGTGAAFMRNSQNSAIGNLVQTGTGTGLIGCTNCSIERGSFSGDVLAAYSSKCSFKNMTATASSYVFTSGHEAHVVENSTLNAVYYGSGFGASVYTAPFKFGVYSLWVSADGKLRIKSGVPTSDTDGTIVGQQ